MRVFTSELIGRAFEKDQAPAGSPQKCRDDGFFNTVLKYGEKPKKVVWVTARAYHHFIPEGLTEVGEYDKDIEAMGETSHVLPEWVIAKMARLLREAGIAKKEWQDETQNWNWQCSRLDHFEQEAAFDRKTGTLYAFSFRKEEALRALRKKSYLPHYVPVTEDNMAALAAHFA